MTRRAKLYIFTVVAAGAAIVASAAVLWNCQSATRFLACLCLAILASTLKVKLPGLEGCISPSFIPLLFLAGTMSWQETVVMAALSGAVQSLWNPKRPPMAVQVLFNSANLAIAIGAGYTVSHAVAPNQIPLQLIVAVLLFEVINTLSVSTVVCLVSDDDPITGVWRNCRLWTFPYHLSGAILAALWAQNPAPMSLSITVLGAVILYLMSTFFQELVSRVGAVDRAS